MYECKNAYLWGRCEMKDAGRRTQDAETGPGRCRLIKPEITQRITRSLTAMAAKCLCLYLVLSPVSPLSVSVSVWRGGLCVSVFTPTCTPPVTPLDCF